MVRSDIKHCSRFQQVHGNWTLSVYGKININTPPPPVFPCFKDIRSHLWQKRGVHRGAAWRGGFAVIESSSNSVHRHARPRPPPIGSAVAWKEWPCTARRIRLPTTGDCRQCGYAYACLVPLRPVLLARGRSGCADNDKGFSCTGLVPLRSVLPTRGRSGRADNDKQLNV